MKNVLIIVLLSITLFNCEAEPKPNDKLVHVEPDYNDNLVQHEPEEKPETSNVVVEGVRYWSSSETKLPSGVVESYDCLNRGITNQNVKDNYVTIKRTNGYLTVVKDIDEDLFLNIKIGDIIN